MNLAAMELRHLRYFLAVAEAAHFTRAAARLHVSQPTLSQQIRALEGQLGLTLFDRVGRGVALTAAGELLLPHARRVMRELDDARLALAELHGLARGTLRVGVMQTVNACLIPELVARFGAAHPGIQLGAREMSVDDIESGLASGALDLGISFLPAAKSGLAGEELFSEELVAVVPAAHGLAERRQLRVRELADTPLALLSPEYCTRRLVDRAFAAAGVRPAIQLETNAVESLVATVRRGHLVTVLPALALCDGDDDLRAVRLSHPTPRRTVGLLWSARAQRRAAAEAFARLARSVLVERGYRSKARSANSSSGDNTRWCRPTSAK